MTDRDRGPEVVLAMVFLGVVVAGMTDLVLDQPDDWLSVHVIVEVAVIALGLGAAAWLWVRWRRVATSLAEAEQSLEVRRAERDAWRASAERALEGFGAALEAQFRSWELTPAEADVALRLVKGHSHKQIAKATGRSERTVRQHAVVAYRKAGVAGRAELAGFFLEDVVLPDRAGSYPSSSTTP